MRPHGGAFKAAAMPTGARHVFAGAFQMQLQPLAGTCPKAALVTIRTGHHLLVEQRLAVRITRDAVKSRATAGAVELLLDADPTKAMLAPTLDGVEHRLLK